MFSAKRMSDTVRLRPNSVKSEIERLNSPNKARRLEQILLQPKTIFKHWTLKLGNSIQSFSNSLAILLKPGIGFKKIRISLSNRSLGL